MILTDFVRHSTLGHLKTEIHTNKYSKGNIKGWDLANSGLLCVVFSPKPPENRNTHQHVQENHQQLCYTGILKVHVQWQCCFTSTVTVRTMRYREPRTATLTFTQLLSAEF